jgi:hypothetical protein
MGGDWQPWQHPAVRSPGDFIQYSLIVTNGRGNPDILGTPAEYKLWVAGDPSQSVAYSISITWFFGPDC